MSLIYILHWRNHRKSIFYHINENLCKDVKFNTLQRFYHSKCPLDPNIGLPNTNNELEGIFADIKTKLLVHSGLSKENRKKLIDEYLSRYY